MKNIILTIAAAAILIALMITDASAQQGTAPAPEKVETRLGTLEYEAGFPTKEPVSKL